MLSSKSRSRAVSLKAWRTSIRNCGENWRHIHWFPKERGGGSNKITCREFLGSVTQAAGNMGKESKWTRSWGESFRLATAVRELSTRSSTGPLVDSEWYCCWEQVVKKVILLLYVNYNLLKMLSGSDYGAQEEEDVSSTKTWTAGMNCKQMIIVVYILLIFNV